MAWSTAFTGGRSRVTHRDVILHLDRDGHPAISARWARRNAAPPVHRPRILVVTPRVDPVDGPVHEGGPADPVHTGDRHRHPAARLAVRVEAPSVGVVGFDRDALQVAMVGIAFEHALAVDERRPVAIA